MKILKYIPLIVCAAFSFVSCDDDDDYAPGRPVDGNCVGVYVSDSNAKEYDLNPELGITSFTIEVSRINTSGTVSVPVNVSSDYAGISAPATVDFADGKATAEYTVDFPGIQSGTMVNINFSFPSEYVNPYKMTDGIASFSCSASVFPVVISDKVTYNVIDNKDYVSVARIITGGSLVKAGFDEYALTNFLGSDVDLYFSLGNYGEGYYDYKMGYAISPLSNFSMVPDDYWNSWTLRNDAGNSDLCWTPAGTDWAIESAMFYGYDRESNYTYINMKDNSGCLYAMITSGGVFDYYYITFGW